MSVTFYANSIQKSGFDAANEPSVSGQVATMSGAETTGPLYDLVDNRRTNTLSLDTNGETTAAVIRLDLTTSISATGMIIDNHNLNTAGALLDLAQGAADVTITASYSGTLGSELTGDTILSGNSTIDTDGVTLLQFSSVSDTRWDLTIDDVSTFSADVTLGEIFLSNYFAPSFNPELQPTFGYDMPGSSYRESDGGQRYGFSTHTNKRRSWRLMWKYMSDSDKSNLEDIFLFTGGTKYPFYIDLNGPLGSTNPHLFYVRFMRPLSFIGLTKDAWQVTIDIEEEI